MLMHACATTPGNYQLYPPAEPTYFPKAPEIARYQYLGALIGEPNFVVPENATQHRALRVWYWLVGLVFGAEGPYTLARPQAGIVDDALGRIYVVDIGRHAVVVFDRATGTLYHWDDASPRQRFKTPVGIALGPRNELWVADSELGVVVRLNAQGEPLGEIGKGVLQRPVGVAWEPTTQRMYVADAAAHIVIAFDTQGREVMRFGKRGEHVGELNAPTHLAVAGGEIYVSDSLNSRVQRFSAQGKWLASLGGRGLTIGDLPRPKGVAVDAAGRVYVVESYYDYLLVYDHENRLLLAIGGNGTGGGQFNLPAGVWLDATGKVYVADMYNGRVEVFQFLDDAPEVPTPPPTPSKVP
ncbi:MAG: 6-bladed beta-propeller [Gammaproteobacteria bacterium]|nr:6-bladed beta-propeller [Gammaproteobacteria bacterium]